MILRGKAVFICHEYRVKRIQDPVNVNIDMF